MNSKSFSNVQKKWHLETKMTIFSSEISTQNIRYFQMFFQLFWLKRFILILTTPEITHIPLELHFVVLVGFFP